MTPICYIEFADLDIYRAVLKEKEFEAKLSRFSDLCDESTFSGYGLSRSQDLDKIHSVTFFGSSIIWSHGYNFAGLTMLLEVVESLNYKLIEEGIPVKGGLTIGEFTGDEEKSLYFGKGLIDAYDLSRQLNQYGIMLSSRVENELFKPNSKIHLEQYYSKISISLISGKVQGTLIFHPLGEYSFRRNDGFEPTSLYIACDGQIERLRKELSSCPWEVRHLWNNLLESLIEQSTHLNPLIEEELNQAKKEK